MKSQIAMSKPGRGGRRTPPYAFTEHGAVMAANILRSENAIQMSIFVVRAFVRMRQLLVTQRGLAAKLAELEKKLTDRLGIHENVIVDVIRQIKQLIDITAKPELPRKKIGFEVKEQGVAYGKKRKVSRR